MWLGQKDSAFLCMLIVNIWKETPYVVLLTIAAKTKQMIASV